MDKIQTLISEPKVYISVSVLVVLYLIIIIINAMSESKSKLWPPFGMACPDYWTTSRSDNGYTCTMDPKNPNKPLNSSFTNNIVSFTNENAILTRGSATQNLNEKKAWANSANIFWDGSQN